MCKILNKKVFVKFAKLVQSTHFCDVFKIVYLNFFIILIQSLKYIILKLSMVNNKMF